MTKLKGWSVGVSKYNNVDICYNVGDEHEFSIVGEVGSGSCLDMKKGAMSDDCKANAHLIAAAPDMYNLLDNINKIGLVDFEIYRSEHSNEITELLAKARGE